MLDPPIDPILTQETTVKMQRSPHWAKNEQILRMIGFDVSFMLICETSYFHNCVHDAGSIGKSFIEKESPIFLLSGYTGMREARVGVCSQVTHRVQYFSSM